MTTTDREPIPITPDMDPWLVNLIRDQGAADEDAATTLDRALAVTRPYTRVEGEPP